MERDSEFVLAGGWNVVADVVAITLSVVAVVWVGGVVWPRSVIVGTAVGLAMAVSRPRPPVLRDRSGRVTAIDRVAHTREVLRCGLRGGVAGTIAASILGISLGPAGVAMALLAPPSALGACRAAVSVWGSRRPDRLTPAGLHPRAVTGWAVGKRMVDVPVALVLLVLLSPLALVARLSPGRDGQLRRIEVSGRFGRRFDIPAATGQETRRRRTLVLWHRLLAVLAGHLSLVGPRPEVTSAGPQDLVEDSTATSTVPDRPGLTGPWALAADEAHGPLRRSAPLQDLAVLLQAARAALGRAGDRTAVAERQVWTTRSTEGPIRVLHVVESLAAGVATALESYIRLTPELEHVVIGHRREGSQIGDDLDDLCDVIDLPSGGFAARRAVLAAFRRVRPELVHAHSSLAGLYVRTIRAIPARQIIYSPHCYAFERRDVSRLSRAVFALVERLLAGRTGTVAAVGEHEASLAAGLRRSTRTVVVPHIPDLPTAEGTRAAASHGGRSLTVAALGRVQPQKGTDFLIKAAALTTRSTRWRWIGGGDEADETLLREAGVDVIGWVPRRQALAELADADVYVHTARWEGMPLTVLEAAGLGLPVVARRIGPLDNIGLPRLADTPDAMAAHIDALQDPGARRSTAAEVQRMIGRHTRQRQRAALLEAYQVELPIPDPPSPPLKEMV